MVTLVPPKVTIPEVDFDKLPSFASETVVKWMNLSYRLFGTMLDNSEYSFYLSTPQFISQLSFLMSICPEKTTRLQKEFGWCPDANDLTNSVQLKNLLENTSAFMKKWKKELNEAAVPGKIKTARRVVSFPTHSSLFHLNTLESLRTHHVEMKIFEGHKEHLMWVYKHLEGHFDKQVVLNMWDEELEDLEAMESKMNNWKNTKQGKIEEEREAERKSPIVMWIETVTIAILPEIFDARSLYNSKGKDYLRVTDTRNKKITVRMGNMPWDSVILPTAHPRFSIVIVYNYSRNLSSLEDITQHITDHQKVAPCIIRPFGVPVMNSAEKRNIYFPNWNDENFHPNRFSEHLRESIDVDEIFTRGGFGDLAQDHAVPLSGCGMYKIAHLQQFTSLNLSNAPTSISAENNAIERPVVDHSASENEVIPFPFCLLVWDSERKYPVYMGKITGKRVPRRPKSRSKAWYEWLFGWIKF